MLGRKLVVRYRPVGVVGVIGPWNYPLRNSFGDCIPALAAGNAVVLKPSEVTPLTSLLMRRGLRECGLPDGVFQVADRRAATTGAALIDDVDMVMFTGSTRDRARRSMERAAQTLTPVSLELGGKDPMIVLADADLERAANAATYYSMQNGGQTCISIERVYVEAPVYDEFVAKVTEKVARAAPGRADRAGLRRRGRDDVPAAARHRQPARRAGPRRRRAGARPAATRREGGGRFFEPTVLADVDHSMTCMTEETFGPTLPIMKVADADEAVRLANDSPYGLAASVLTQGPARAASEIARRHRRRRGVRQRRPAQLPRARAADGRLEGLGPRRRATAPAGIRKYCRQQALLVTRFAPKKDLHFFPYKARTTRLLIKGVQAALRAAASATRPRAPSARAQHALSSACSRRRPRCWRRVHGVLGAAEPLGDLARA